MLNFIQFFLPGVYKESYRIFVNSPIFQFSLSSVMYKYKQIQNNSGSLFWEFRIFLCIAFAYSCNFQGCKLCTLGNRHSRI